MANLTEPRLLTWTVPTPRGLWYRAIVVIDKGLFVTPDIDTKSMNDLKEAASDLKPLVEQLTGHGRFKRAEFFAWDAITGIRHDPSVGTIEIQTESSTSTIKVADRERLEKLARVVAKTVSSQRANAG